MWRGGGLRGGPKWVEGSRLDEVEGGGVTAG